MTARDDLRTVAIPAPWNVQAEYLLTMTQTSAGAQQLCRFILGADGQQFLRSAGFLPANGES